MDRDDLILPEADGFDELGSHLKNTGERKIRIHIGALKKFQRVTLDGNFEIVMGEDLPQLDEAAPDLVKRLRERADHHGTLLCLPPRPTVDKALFDEAAATIEYLQRELAATRLAHNAA
jgi:hypothetical protein